MKYVFVVKSITFSIKIFTKDFACGTIPFVAVRVG